jgi:hypothetical protein
MKRVLGIIASVILLISSVMHTFMGWPAMESELKKSNVAGDVVTGLKIGWQFGGVAILLFGIIAMSTFVRRTDTRAAFLIGVAYTLFGVWALVMSAFNPFFAIFIVPGLLLTIAAWPR